MSIISRLASLFDKIWSNIGSNNFSIFFGAVFLLGGLSSLYYSRSNFLFNWDPMMGGDYGYSTDLMMLVVGWFLLLFGILNKINWSKNNSNSPKNPVFWYKLHLKNRIAILLSLVFLTSMGILISNVGPGSIVTGAKELREKAQEIEQKLKSRNVDKIIIKNARETEKLKHIHSLPFGSSSKLTEPKKALPRMESMVYWPLETDFDFNFKQHEILIHLDSFNAQLPDIDKYQMYFTRLNEVNAPDTLRKTLFQNFVALNCGFIIVYDASSKQAQIINVENDFYIDASISMQFEISSEYRIRTTEDMSTDGDYDDESNMISTETIKVSEHNIEIQENGKFIIEKINLDH